MQSYIDNLKDLKILLPFLSTLLIIIFVYLVSDIKTNTFNSEISKVSCWTKVETIYGRGGVAGYPQFRVCDVTIKNGNIYHVEEPENSYIIGDTVKIIEYKNIFNGKFNYDVLQIP